MAHEGVVQDPVLYFIVRRRVTKDLCFKITGLCTAEDKYVNKAPLGKGCRRVVWLAVMTMLERSVLLYVVHSCLPWYNAIVPAVTAGVAVAACTVRNQAEAAQYGHIQ